MDIKNDIETKQSIIFKLKEILKKEKNIIYNIKKCEILSDNYFKYIKMYNLICYEKFKLKEKLRGYLYFDDMFNDNIVSL